MLGARSLNAVVALVTSTSPSQTPRVGEGRAITRSTGEKLDATVKFSPGSIVPVNSTGSGAWNPASVSLASYGLVHWGSAG